MSPLPDAISLPTEIWYEHQRRWVFAFMFSFQDAQKLCFRRQISKHIVGFTALPGIREEVEAAVYHLNGNGRKRLVERFRHSIGQVNQDDI